MPYLNDRVLDFGLSILDLEASHIFVCSSEPASYAAAISAALGVKAVAAGAAFTAPAAALPDGRKVSSVEIIDGDVTVSGDATHYAVVDEANDRLLAAGALDAPVTVLSGAAFTLPSFDVRIPAPV